jgi:hypothetical protein
MFVNFYNAPNGSHKDVEFVFESPEEYQLWCRSFPNELPTGQVMAPPAHGIKTIQTRYGKRAQPYIRLGVRNAGEEIEIQPGDKPLKPPVVKGLAPVPQGVKSASDEQLEVIAARAGVRVTEQWRKRNRALRESDVTSAMEAKKEKEAVTA